MNAAQQTEPQRRGTECMLGSFRALLRQGVFRAPGPQRFVKRMEGDRRLSGARPPHGGALGRAALLARSPVTRERKVHRVCVHHGAGCMAGRPPAFSAGGRGRGNGRDQNRGSGHGHPERKRTAVPSPGRSGGLFADGRSPDAVAAGPWRQATLGCSGAWTFVVGRGRVHGPSPCQLHAEDALCCTIFENNQHCPRTQRILTD